MSKLKEFLARKDIVISPQRYLIDALGAMAQGLFASLLIGTIIKTVGQQTGLALLVDGENVDIRYDLAPVPFDRIRRITGYLVGTMDRWNDAKTSEESDRVKHGVCRDDRAFACANGC